MELPEELPDPPELLEELPAPLELLEVEEAETVELPEELLVLLAALEAPELLEPLELLEVEEAETVELPEELLEPPVLLAAPELLELELELELELTLATATVAELGEPKSAAPGTDVKATLKFLPAALGLTGTVIVCAEASPSLHLSEPLVRA